MINTLEDLRRELTEAEGCVDAFTRQDRGLDDEALVLRDLFRSPAVYVALNQPNGTYTRHKVLGVSTAGGGILLGVSPSIHG